MLEPRVHREIKPGALRDGAVGEEGDQDHAEMAVSQRAEEPATDSRGGSSSPPRQAVGDRTCEWREVRLCNRRIIISSRQVSIQLRVRRSCVLRGWFSRQPSRQMDCQVSSWRIVGCGNCRPSPGVVLVEPLEWRERKYHDRRSRRRNSTRSQRARDVAAVPSKPSSMRCCGDKRHLYAHRTSCHSADDGHSRFLHRSRSARLFRESLFGAFQGLLSPPAQTSREVRETNPQPTRRSSRGDLAPPLT